MVMPRFVGAALSGEALTVYGDGTQSRCFCHVKDAVRAIIALSEEPAAAGQVFNIGATEQISILNLAKRVVSITNSSSEIVFIPYEQAYGEGFEDLQRRSPDITRIQKLLGWTSEYLLDDIVLDIANWLSREHSAENQKHSSS
jgi:UDP-glucose 4-epimerase